jgi:hypothetical protein
MTKQERKNYIASFQNRRSSRITHLTSGYQEQFGEPQKAGVSLSAEPGDGWLPSEGNADQDPNNNWKTAVVGSISYIQKAIDLLGESNPEMVDALNRWASSADALVRASNDGIKKANVNRSDDGTTRPPMVYPANAQSSRPGPSKTITASELASLPENAKALFAKYQKLGFVQIKL